MDTPLRIPPTRTGTMPVLAARKVPAWQRSILKSAFPALMGLALFLLPALPCPAAGETKPRFGSEPEEPLASITPSAN